MSKFSKPKYTKEQLIYYLKELSKKLKKTPTIKDLKKNKYPSITTYVKRFGSWNRALENASLIINQKKFTKQDLIENLKLLEKEIQKTPMPKDLKNRKWAGSYSSYLKYFKSWDNALKEAKLEKNNFFSLKKFTKKKENKKKK